MPEIDYNEVMSTPRDRILLFTGALFGAEVANVVKDVFSRDTTDVEALSKALLARLNDAEKKYLIEQAKKEFAAKPEVPHPLRKKGRNFEGEVTEQFLIGLAKKLELSDIAPARLWRLLETDPVQKMAAAAGLDIRTGSNNGYPQDHLRELENRLQEIDSQPEGDKIHGLGPNSQTRRLLKEAVAEAAE